MGIRVESVAHYTDNACMYYDVAEKPPAEIDESACRRAMAEEAITDAACGTHSGRVDPNLLWSSDSS